MKLFIKRYANYNKDVIGYARIESDFLTILKKDGKIRGILNGCEIFDTSSKINSYEKIACLVGNILHEICCKKKLDTLILYKDHWKQEPNKNLLKRVASRIDEDIKIIIRNRPKETINNFLPVPKVSTSIEWPILNKNLNIFSKKISNANIALNNAISEGKIITGRDLIKSMWGAKKTQEYLNKKQLKIATLTENLENITHQEELILRGISKLKNVTKETSISKDRKKVLARIIIPSIVESYEEHKKDLLTAALELSPLLYVDEIFKNNTNYPVSWFISEENINNLKEDYKHLLSYLNDIPKIEKRIIIPLDVLGSQIIK